MKKKRNRSRPPLPLQERLRQIAVGAREKAAGLPPGHVRVRKPRAPRAAAMSLGWVAIQASLAPMTACWRLKPPMAAQPLPGWRLLQA